MVDAAIGGKKEELSKEAKDMASKLEVLAQALEILHRGIVAPELAALVEFDRRLAELTAKLANLKTEADVAAIITLFARSAAAPGSDPREQVCSDGEGEGDSGGTGDGDGCDQDHGDSARREAGQL